MTIQYNTIQIQYPLLLGALDDVEDLASVAIYFVLGVWLDPLTSLLSTMYDKRSV